MDKVIKLVSDVSSKNQSRKHQEIKEEVQKYKTKQSMNTLLTKRDSVCKLFILKPIIHHIRPLTECPTNWSGPGITSNNESAGIKP